LENQHLQNIITSIDLSSASLHDVTGLALSRCANWRRSAYWEVPRNVAEALPLFQRAAALNQGNAMVYLVSYHKLALGVPEDPAESARLFQAAAAQDNLLGIGNLTICYPMGWMETRLR
jgi:TPR repeat protein